MASDPQDSTDPRNNIDPRNTIDPRNNPESRATERGAAVPISRAGSGSVVPAEQAPPMRAPADGASGGAADGDPLSGVTADPADIEDAVSGRAGADRPGSELDGPGGGVAPARRVCV